MKKVLLLIIPLLFISCATTGTKNAAAKSTKYPWSTFNVKAGQEIKMPVDCGFISYGKTTIQIGDWDYSIPKEFGNKTLVASFPYTYYFNGKKHDVFYEVIIKDVNLKKEIQDLPLYSEIKTASRCLMMKNDNMTKNQYFYLDCIIVLFGCCLMSTSDPKL